MAKKTTTKKTAAPKKTVVRRSTTTTTRTVASEVPTTTSSDAPSRYLGTTSGLRVKAFQNKSLKDNLTAHLTDTALAALWRAEFPRAAKFDEKMVRSVRAAFNRGAHGNDEPKTKVPAYDETGTALPFRGEKAKNVKVEKPAAKTGKVLKLKKSA